MVSPFVRWSATTGGALHTPGRLTAYAKSPRRDGGGGPHRRGGLRHLTSHSRRRQRRAGEPVVVPHPDPLRRSRVGPSASGRPHPEEPGEARRRTEEDRRGAEAGHRPLGQEEAPAGGRRAARPAPPAHPPVPG